MFYIGIGSDNRGYHRRAHQTANRNPYWWNIYNKTKIRVEIIQDNISYEEAKRLEIFYIAFYKRKEDGGTLANITKGGEGRVGATSPHLIAWNKKGLRKGAKHTKKSLRLMSKVQKKVDRSTTNPGYKGTIYAYKDGELIKTYSLAQEICKEINKSIRSVRHYIQNNIIIKGILYTRNEPGRNTKSQDGSISRN